MQGAGRRSQRDRTEATTAALIAAARRLFVERGYAGTATPDLVAAAEVTRGALYHHFADKKDLFRAVVDTECRKVAEEIEHAAGPEPDPVEALLSGGEAYLAAMAEPGRTRLLLVEAPAVLGRAEIDEFDAMHAGRTLREGLAAAMEAGAVRTLPLDAASALVGAAFDRAALAAEAGGDAAACRAVLRALIEGLCVAPPQVAAC